MDKQAPTPTLEDIRSWPATISVEQAALALGISRNYLYELIRSGESPVATVPGVNRCRIITASLIALLSGVGAD